jgi:hypothetical protein
VEIDRLVGGARAATSLPAVRPPPVGRVRPQAAPGSGGANGPPVFDEAIDIHLGIDRQTGHLAIVGGDVRFEARPSDRPLPGSPAYRRSSGTDRPPPRGTLVNVVV